MKVIVHVVQYEHSGIPDEPLLFTDPREAMDRYYNLIREQGFREIRPGETLEKYYDTYWDVLNQCDDTDWEQNLEDSPDFDPDDTIRYWEIELK